MIRGLYTAVSGMITQEAKQDVITNNLANADTNGYKTEILGIKKFDDVLIEPQRAKLIPSFYQVKAAVMNEGALGFSISGSGPSVFAWVDSKEKASKVQAVAVAIFAQAGLKTDSWISPLSSLGARVV